MKALVVFVVGLRCSPSLSAVPRLLAVTGLSGANNVAHLEGMRGSKNWLRKNCRESEEKSGM